MYRTQIFVILALWNPLVWGNEKLDLSQLIGWDIVLTEDAIPSEVFAAQEFQTRFKQAVGTELQSHSSASQPIHHIWIGPGAAAMAGSVGFTTNDLGEEDLRIQITPDNIIIAGGRPRGTLYAVYEFMERYMGIRFLTYDHTYIPVQSVREIPCELYTYHPPFSFRWSFYKENVDHPELAARLRVNTTPQEEKYGGITQQHLISHSLYHLLPVDKYGKEHPEYFAWVNGERKLVMDGGGPELCVTNPDVIDIVSENVMKDLDAYPNQKNYSVSQNDNDAYCHCDRCEAVNQREGTPMGSHLAFVNAVAERVEKKYPNVKIGTLSYWYTRKPPKTIVPRKNVQIQLCSIECCTLHALNDPECVRNQEFCRDMDEWSKICKDIWIWNYNTNFSFYELPFPNWRCIGPNLQYFKTHNVKGVFMQANGNGSSGELCDLRNYVISRCMWNPSLDGWKEAEEFCRLHYQEAGESMIGYLKMMFIRTLTAGHHPGCFPRPFELGLTPEFSQKIFQKFVDIKDQAKNPETSARVEKASICAYRAVIETCGQLVFNQDRLKIAWPYPLDSIVDHYAELVQRHNVSMAAETLTMQDFLNRLKKDKDEGVAAVQLENKVWRLIVVPEDNGKTVQMIYKPTNRNLLFDISQNGLGRLFSERNFREVGTKGYDHNAPAAFTAQVEASVLTLSKTLQDGSTVVRKIQLQPDDPKKIYCETLITHQGEEPKEYQIRAISDFNVETLTQDSSVVTGYVKDQTWKSFTNGWKNNSGPQKDNLEQAKGGAFAFFNDDKQFGMQISFNPDQVEKPEYTWSATRPSVTLGILTPAKELKKTESVSLQYQLEFLENPPK